MNPRLIAWGSAAAALEVAMAFCLARAAREKLREKAVLLAPIG